MKNRSKTSALAGLAASLILVGCAGGPGNGAPASQPLPEGAIKAGAGLYMIPLAQAVENCPAYRAYAPGRMVAQVIYFRAKDGRFVTDRREADCP